ncbi:MAG: AgmX/PglI C-terminal domain-containing protein [Myxococcales bacterium]|nr:AgmX/PglI C-terminal domain-containing protein [Myxococcales bacterium]
MRAKLPEPAALPPRPAGDAGASTARLDAEDVQTAIQAAKPAVAGCYEQALKRTPDLGGRLLVQFTIRQGEGKGSLGDAEVIEDGLGNPFLGMCVIDALAKVDYPAPSGQGEVVVKYPFVLKPAEGEP